MGARILVADDSVTIQKVVELTFSKEDFEVVPARNGDEAIMKAKSSRPDLMLIDVVMPGKNGYEVCETLRRDPVFKDVPVILMTGTFEAFDKEEALRVGANDFVAKPFESQALISKVKQLLFSSRIKAQERVLKEPPPVVSVAPAEPEMAVPEVKKEVEPEEAIPVYEIPEEVEEALEVSEPIGEEVTVPILGISEKEEEVTLQLEIEEPVTVKETPTEAPLQEVTLGLEEGPKEEELLILEPLEELPPLRPEVEIFPEKAPRLEEEKVVTPLETPLREELEVSPAPPGVSPVSLSPEDTARIAEDVAEKVASRVAQELSQRMAEKIERVVWEVVPDLAEMLIIKEIERIKAEIEGKGSN